MAQAPTGGGAFVKAKEIESGDTCQIINEADWIDSTFTKDDGSKQQQFVCQVKYKDEDRRLKLTVASCGEIAPVFGKDSKDWIGKTLKLEPMKVMVGGSVKDTILATPAPMTAEEKNAEAAANPPPTEVPWDE